MFGMFFVTLYGVMVVAIVPIIVVLNIRKNRKKNHNQDADATYVGRGYYMPGDRSRQGNMYGNTRGSMAGNASGNNLSGEQGGLGGQAAGNKTAGGSTTEYLERKAMEDQREHAAEKMEEQRRVNARYGNMPIARRHILGDPVPSGMEIVCCKYCGAANEVKTGYHRGLCCYFCRTEL